MTALVNAIRHREVAPLELFFDLVFVLAIGQLTHHLIGHLTWQGAAETLILLIGVCSVWVFTTFEVTLLDIERRGTHWLTVITMGLALFMNAGIGHAFDDSPWLFVVPMIAGLVGPCLYAAVASPTAQLRGHFVRVLVWCAVSTPLWVAGAAVDHEYRLWLWAGAAAVDGIGAWTAHPVPGRTTHTGAHPFDAAHIVERMRLFLIILLGETVLTLGRVVSDHHDDALTLAMALAGFVALVCLWSAYFGRAEQEVVRHTAVVDDPIRSVHVGLTCIYGVVAGLVVFAAGTELVLSHAHESHAGVAGILVLLGPAAYLVAQAAYFRVETGSGWAPRVVAAIVLGVAAAPAYFVPAYAAMAAAVAILAATAAVIGRPAA
jgi:low temperature requirement protein LtrA